MRYKKKSVEIKGRSKSKVSLNGGRPKSFVGTNLAGLNVGRPKFWSAAENLVTFDRRFISADFIFTDFFYTDYFSTAHKDSHFYIVKR